MNKITDIYIYVYVCNNFTSKLYQNTISLQQRWNKVNGNKKILRINRGGINNQPRSAWKFAQNLTMAMYEKNRDYPCIEGNEVVTNNLDAHGLIHIYS